MFLYYIITALGGAIIALTIYIAVYRLVYKGRANSIIEKATADAAATFSESTPWAMGMRTV